MNKKIMRNMGFAKEVEKVEQGLCSFCDMKIDVSTFRDGLSRKEFRISGLCQKCQDRTFGRQKGEMR